MRTIQSEDNSAAAVRLNPRTFRNYVDRNDWRTNDEQEFITYPEPLTPRPSENRVSSRLYPSVAALDTFDWDEIDSLSGPEPNEFLHPCETHFVQFLNSQQISWRYKTRTFAVEWDQEGNFVDCFTPDFYLPASDLYVALLAPDIRESGEKTRKVRLLRQAHPEVKIEVFAFRDLLESTEFSRG